VRIGSPLVTTRGMGEPEMDEIAACIADLVERIDDMPTLDGVRERTFDLCRRFPIPYALD
jgi:glycine hydroxymethyltransferase